MGWRDWANNVGDFVEDALEKGVEKVGQIVDDGLDVAADVADTLGAEGVSEFLDDAGDQVASFTGGPVEERELGQTRDPKELIRGDPTAISDAAKNLRDMGSAISKTGDALRTIDAADWTGQGADAFNAVYDKQPKLWWDASEAMNEAAGALENWSGAVKTAQDRAADAIAEWDRADREERAQKARWNSLTGEQQAESPLVDSWTSIRDNARDILRTARVARDNAAGETTGKLADATAKAPTEPPFLSRWDANLSDLLDFGEHAGLSFTDGLLTGLTGIGQFVRSVNPTDIYNLTHPAEYVKSLSDMGTGLVVAVADPGKAVQTILADARKNPFEALGSLTGDALLTAATGGGGAVKPLLKGLDRLSDAGRRMSGPDSGAPPGPARGDSSSRQPPPAPTRGDAPPPRDGTPERPAAGPRPEAQAPDRRGENEPGAHPNQPETRANPRATPDNQPDPGVESGPRQDDPAPPRRETEDPDPALPTQPDPEPRNAPEGPRTEPDASPEPPAQRAEPAPQQPDPAPRPEPTPDPPPRSPEVENPAQRPDMDTRPDTDAPPQRPDADTRPRPDAEVPTQHPDGDSRPRPDAEVQNQRPDTDTRDADPPAQHPSADTYPRPEADTPTQRPETDTQPDTEASAPEQRPEPESPEQGAKGPGEDADPSTPRTDDTRAPTTSPDSNSPATQSDPNSARPAPEVIDPAAKPNTGAPIDRGTELDTRTPVDGTHPKTVDPERVDSVDTHRGDPDAPRNDVPGATTPADPGSRRPDAPATTRGPENSPRQMDTSSPRSPDARHSGPDRSPNSPERSPDTDRPKNQPDSDARPRENSKAPKWQGESRPDAKPGPDRDADPDGREKERGDREPGANDRPDRDRDKDDQGDKNRSDEPKREPERSPEDDSGTRERDAPRDPNFEDRADNDRDAFDSTKNDPTERDRTPDHVEERGDPVDVATGEFLLPETDLALPGVLPLLLRRRHRSNYRFGRWFGPSWSATFDLRVIVSADGVTFVGDDGVMLAYPHAAPDVPVAPLTGSLRWTLTRTEAGGYRVWDPERELLWHFSPEPALAGRDTALGNYAISAITDRHHNRIRFHYDAHGNPVEVAHSGGYRVLVTAAAGRVTDLSVTVSEESAVPIRHFDYTAGELSAVTTAASGVTRYTYDDEHRMVSWTDANGNSMINTYDSAGRVVRQRGPAGVLDCAWSYFEFPDGTGRLSSRTDSLGAVTTYGFDADLRLRDVADPLGRQVHYDYNSDRKPLQVIAPDGAITLYRYTEHGDLAGVTRPDGRTVELEYSFQHRPSRITDVDGAVQQREWDQRGNLSAVTAPDGGRTCYTYHPCGAVATITEPGGAVTRIDVDAAGLPIRVAGPLDAVVTLERDGFGRPVRMTEAHGGTTTLRWSADGKLLERVEPDGRTETWAYDPEGNLLARTDPAGHTTHFTYGAFDLLLARTEPDGSSTRYTWDTERRLVAVTNPNGQAWLYSYDAAGQLLAQTDYTGATTQYARDAAGRVATIRPPTGVARHYTYDGLGRLTATTSEAGDWRRYTHDISGRVLTAISGHGETALHTLEFGYTPTGMLDTQRLDDQAPMRFGYDAAGRRTSRVSPSGAETRWRFNILGLPTGMSTDGHDIDFEHDPAGRLTRWSVGELAVDRRYDEGSRLIRQDVTAFPAQLLNLGLGTERRPEPASLRTDEYSWRADGYITSHTTHRADAGPTRRDYQLDPIGRIATLRRNGVVTEQYEYDALGNITGGPSRDPAPSDRREYRNNLLIRDGRTRYHYDGAGRLIRKTATRLSHKPDIWHYRYDSFDQLVEVVTPDGEHWHYSYDALGRRAAKQHRADDGVVLERVDYTWDGTHLIEQADAVQRTRWQYHPGAHTPITQATDQAAIDREFYAIVTDLVGTPVELIAPDEGRSAAVVSTNLWGHATWQGRASTSLRFPGQIYDPETGLHNNLSRVYDPDTGRFLTSDPLGLGPAPNPAVYPPNPTVWSDPLGLVPEGCDADLSRDTHLFSDSNDPLRRHGSARETHPEEVARLEAEARALGVRIEFRPGAMAYGPSPSVGHAGQLIIDPDASYGAWLHEIQHMRDDRASEWTGTRAMWDLETRAEWERRAYRQEIEYARSIGDKYSEVLLYRALKKELRAIFGTR
ncbi:putative T7SS-secreted protein [Nocardia sp. NPDC048505]|uniref:putative T7SS-secreted protein n=1 Tax=unclassified Nocardia TaxID=2637762 RepID=UPI0033C30D0A